MDRGYIGYYYSEDGGEALGPYAKEDLIQLVKDGDVSKSAVVCAEGSDIWSPIIAILRPKSETAPIMPSFTPGIPSRKLSPPPQKPQNTIDPRITHFENANGYLIHLRKNSCYGTLRSVITILTVLSFIGLYALAFALNGIMGGAVAIIGTVFIIAARQASLLLIDLVDAHLERYSKKAPSF